MKKNKNIFKPLTLSALTMIALSQPVKAREIESNTISYFPQGVNSIEIPVPRPENFGNGFCQEALKPAIDKVIQEYGGKWGVLIQSVNQGYTLYQHNADNGLIPASNTKLLTTAAALQRLNPQSSIRSTSLSNWIAITNRRSNNSYADVLLSHIGGSRVAKQTLSKLGVNPRSFHLADGSGLSRNNLATPRALVQLLRAMYYDRNQEVFLSSLPVAGVSGTLRNRLKNTPVRGRVLAKTGTLRGVRALSGYLDHPEYGTLAFSIIVNQPNRSGTSLVRAIDRIVLNLNQTIPCE